MIKRKKTITMVFAAGLLVFLFTSCYKTDPDKISDDFVWSPDISLALGEVETSLSKIPPNDVPYHYSATLYDTINVDISDLFDKREYVDSMIFRLNIENQFPAQGRVFIFYPVKGQDLDYDRSLTGDQPVLIAAGRIDSEGKSTIPSKKQEDISVTSSQIDDLFTASFLVIRTDVIDIIVDQPVKNNLLNYKFSSQVGLQAKLTIAYE